MPSLSKKHSGASRETFSLTIDWALRIVILLGAPAALALIVLAEPLVASLFFYGAMTEHDVFMSAESLRAYALGLLAFMFIKVLATGYFSRQDMKTPVKIGIIAMTVNMALNLMLIFPLQHTGLALATALSSWLNAYLLLRGLSKADVYCRTSGWGLFLLRVLLASLAMIFLVHYLNSSTEQWFVMDLWQRVTNLAVLVAAGIGSYFVIIMMLGLNIKTIIKAPTE